MTTTTKMTKAKIRTTTIQTSIMTAGLVHFSGSSLRPQSLDFDCCFLVLVLPCLCVRRVLHTLLISTTPAPLYRSERRSNSNSKCDCGTTIVADKFFLASEWGQNSPARAVQHMVNIMIEADRIYRHTILNGIRGYGLSVNKVMVFSEGKSPNYLDVGHTDVDSLLTAFSTQLKGYGPCHSHLFTDRNFKGTLGLAYIGTLCYSGVNTGFSSSYGIPYIVQQLTVTHEIGHGWGAEHDPDYTSECSPGWSNGGNYIMYAAANDGSQTNNLVFSSCSIAQMSNVLQKASCFQEHRSSHCGNGIVEQGEVCDCGATCENSCCTTSCTVNTAAGFQCSPQNPMTFPCCTAEDGSAGQCMFVEAAANKVCNIGSSWYVL